MSEGAHVLRSQPGGGDTSELLAPSVGIYTASVRVGDLVAAGQSIGTIEVLGVERSLIVPDGTAGRVSRRFGGGRTRVPVQYGDTLVAVSTGALRDVSAAEATSAGATDEALTFDAPMSGRFYSRPAPGEPPFVEAGDTVTRGQTVGLLEVMKTFNRLVYQGDALPEQAVVERIAPNDGDDVVRGDPILLLELSGG